MLYCCYFFFTLSASSAYPIKKCLFTGIHYNGKLCNIIFGNPLIFCKNHEGTLSIFRSRVSIDSGISKKQQFLQAGCSLEPDCQSMQTVNQINNRAVCLLNGLIEFKENILREVSNCRLFTANYPLLIKHIIREANHYIRLLKTECED